MKKVMKNDKYTTTSNKDIDKVTIFVYTVKTYGGNMAIKGDNKRSIATFSNKERQDSRNKAMKEAVSSKEAAGRFLKSAGILNRKGVVSERYRSK